MWDILGNYIRQQGNSLICVLGDFNAIRNAAERVGRSNCIDHRDIDCFNDFINLANLFEIPLSGRFFTWYRKDGTCKSKLDRLLVNDDWLNKWPNLSLKSGGRSFSDHCSIFTEVPTKIGVQDRLNSLTVGFHILNSARSSKKNGRNIIYPVGQDSA